MSGYSCMLYSRYQHWGGFTFVASANLDPTVPSVPAPGYLRGSLHRRPIRPESVNQSAALGIELSSR